MERLKVLTLVGTRPELIKLSRVIAELDRRTEHVLVHSGQNYDYELNEVFFEQLEVRRPDHFLDAAGGTAAETIGRVIVRADEVLAREAPDAVLMLGDTNSCLAAISAKRRKIPIFHMEAGNRSFDQRIPEEINRKIVDHVSDVNLPYTEHARRYLLAEGLDPERVIKTGSPMREVLEHYAPGIEASKVLEDLGLEPGGYFVASAHREENVDDPERLARLLDALEALAEEHGRPVVFSTHPRTRQRLAVLGREASESIRFLAPLGFLDYVRLQQDAFCVLSDSGSLTEEASILDLPAVTIRDAHERPEGMDEGTILMSGLGTERILQAVELVTAQHAAAGDGRCLRMAEDYAPRDVSRKVVGLILSYVDYVGSTVWRRPV